MKITIDIEEKIIELIEEYCATLEYDESGSFRDFLRFFKERS